jgi:hypothetical protein
MVQGINLSERRRERLKGGSSSQRSLPSFLSILSVGNYHTAIKTITPHEEHEGKTITPRTIAPATAKVIALRLTIQSKVTFASSGRWGS